MTSSSVVCRKSEYQAPTDPKRAGRVQADDLVGLLAQGGADLRRRDGHGHHDPLRLVLPDGAHGRHHRRAGGQAVVHQDDDAVR